MAYVVNEPPSSLRVGFAFLLAPAIPGLIAALFLGLFLLMNLEKISGNSNEWLVLIALLGWLFAICYLAALFVVLPIFLSSPQHEYSKSNFMSRSYWIAFSASSVLFFLGALSRFAKLIDVVAGLFASLVTRVLLGLIAVGMANLIWRALYTDRIKF